ncbi:hypothetical protein BC827DRAFT_1157805 [Russula dissimulans]|nr:hypothetical protein BC827DRAFT_1157805 [Russula dissimulans]
MGWDTQYYVEPGTHNTHRHTASYRPWEHLKQSRDPVSTADPEEYYSDTRGREPIPAGAGDPNSDAVRSFSPDAVARGKGTSARLPGMLRLWFEQRSRGYGHEFMSAIDGAYKPRKDQLMHDVSHKGV